MLPAAASPRGVTVVLVPLVSLRDNMLDRCYRAGIQCAEWNPEQPPDGAQIVLVTPEGTLSEEFQHFINRIRASGELDRFIVDECHVVIDSKNGDWRQNVPRAIAELSQHETQMVHLTATLRP